MINLPEEITHLLETEEFYKDSFKTKKPLFFPIGPSGGAICLPENKKILGKAVPALVCHEKGDNFYMMLPKQELDEFAQYLIKKLENERFFRKIISQIERENKKFERLIAYYDSLKKRELSKKEIIALYDRYLKELNHFRIYAWIPNTISMGNYNALSMYREMLSKTLSNEEFSVLTNFSDITRSTASEKELLKLISEKKTDDKSLAGWIGKWGYVYYYYTGPLPTLADVRNLIAALDKGLAVVKARIKEINDYPKNVTANKKRLIKKLGLTKKDMHLLEVISYFNYYKAERKELMQKSYVAVDNVFFRLKQISGLELDDLKLLTLEETKRLLDADDKSSFRGLIEQRKKEFICISHSKGLNLISDPKQLDEISRMMRTVTPLKKLMIAFSAAPVRGKLVIINSKSDLEKIKDMKEPFILASSSTYPDLLPAMTRAAGIVTKVGGMTSHAAIVSRELKKPCIVGYSDLFEEFKEGEMVELDTKEGKLTRI